MSKGKLIVLLSCLFVVLCVVTSCSSAVVPHAQEPDRKSEPETVAETPVGPISELETWLTSHPKVMSNIKWKASSYFEWNATQKEQLYNEFQAIRKGEPTQFADPLPNLTRLEDNDRVITVISENTAWHLYLAYIAHSLVVEIDNLVPWSLLDESAGDLSILFDSTHMFRPSAAPDQWYVEGKSLGGVLPASPEFTFEFLKENGLISSNRLQTIGQVLDWCRQNLQHYTGAFEAKNVEDQWQYRGAPPVSRIIKGTPVTSQPERGIAHRTAGCWGTSGFLHIVLRVVNIPVTYVIGGGHALPYFTSEGKYLSHGDDPYSQYTDTILPFPASELLIDQSTYDSWFSVAGATNVGRRAAELGVKYLSLNLLNKYCSDLSRNISDHAEGDVFNSSLSRWYTLEELEAIGLWRRMDATVAGLGGCDELPSTTRAVTPTPTPIKSSSFEGKWLNEDPNTRSITRVNIRSESGKIFIHMWGKCHPSDCDWGEEKTEVSDAADGVFSITWTTSFCIRSQEITLLSARRLMVVGHTHYTDSSGRPDYESIDYFLKE